MRFSGDFTGLLTLNPEDMRDRHECPFCGRVVGDSHLWGVITFNGSAYIAHADCAQKFTANPEVFSNHDDENDTYGQNSD